MIETGMYNTETILDEIRQLWKDGKSNKEVGLYLLEKYPKDLLRTDLEVLRYVGFANLGLSGYGRYITRGRAVR